MGYHELLDLLFRWLHLIAGIMWIGNSMLFNWLDRNLVASPEFAEQKGFQGQIWMVHSGAFYDVRKLLLEPNQMPQRLHWFKWQNGVTWMSGIALLVVYYLRSPSLDARALGVSIGGIVGGWLIYDLLWRTLGKRADKIASALSLAILTGVALLFTANLSGHSAYLHIGVFLGTVMTGNVWFVILPSQRELVAATVAGRPQDPELSIRAKQRSIHNNYMTFPLLFIMLSQHFPSTYGHTNNLPILLVLMAAGASIRHLMNIRFWFKHWLAPSIAIGVGAIAAVLLLSRQAAPAAASGQVVPSFDKAQAVVTQRCLSCHSSRPTDDIFVVAPNNIVMDTAAQMRALAPRIKVRAVAEKTMPFVNKTGMSDEERKILGAWVDEGAPIP
jgi:uncharacterized membrane protein